VPGRYIRSRMEFAKRFRLVSLWGSGLRTRPCFSEGPHTAQSLCVTVSGSTYGPSLLRAARD